MVLEKILLPFMYISDSLSNTVYDFYSFNSDKRENFLWPVRNHVAQQEMSGR